MPVEWSTTAPLDTLNSKNKKNTKPDENLKYVLCDKHKKSLLKMSKGLSESVNRRNTAEIHMN